MHLTKNKRYEKIETIPSQRNVSIIGLRDLRHSAKMIINVTSVSHYINYKFTNMNMRDNYKPSPIITAKYFI